MLLFLGQSFWIRRLVTWARQATIETVPERAQGWPDFFDNTKGIGPIERTLFYKDSRTGIMLPFKGRAEPVPIEQKTGVEAHITATAFGTTKAARAFWKKNITNGIIPMDVVAFYGAGFDSSAADYHDRVAERMALHQRFWTVPYHYVGLLNGDLLYNNPATRYTYHGNGGNKRLVGVSAEANLPGLEKNRAKKHSALDEHFIETNRATLRLAVTKEREAGAPIEGLYAHRQYSDGRLGDPGEGWWKEVGIPMSQEMHLERRVTFFNGTGTQICREWDPLGQVDYRGRKLAA